MTVGCWVRSWVAQKIVGGRSRKPEKPGSPTISTNRSFLELENDIVRELMWCFTMITLWIDFWELDNLGGSECGWIETNLFLRHFPPTKPFFPEAAPGTPALQELSSDRLSIPLDLDPQPLCFKRELPWTTLRAIAKHFKGDGIIERKLINNTPSSIEPLALRLSFDVFHFPVVFGYLWNGFVATKCQPHFIYTFAPVSTAKESPLVGAFEAIFLFLKASPRGLKEVRSDAGASFP